MNGPLVALRSEIFVGLHTLGSKLVIVTPALLVALQYTLAKLTAAGTEARDSLLGQSSFDEALSNNAWGYFVDGLSTGLTLLGLLLVAMSAYSFSFDRDTGAVRHLLIRRVSRPALVLAKLVYFHILALLAIVLLLAVCYFLSGSLWEFGPVVEDGFELIGEDEIRAEISLGLRLALLPLPAAIALGVLVSVLANSATAAVTGALGITLAMDLFKGMLGDGANYLYARFQPSLLDQSYLQDVGRLVRGYSDVLVDERLLQLNAWAPWPALALFTALAVAIVHMRKL